MRYPLDESHDPALTSWVEGAEGHSEFPIQNLPLGVFSQGGEAPRIGVAIGDSVLDMHGVAEAGLLPEDLATAFRAERLNAFFSLPQSRRQKARKLTSLFLSDDDYSQSLLPLLRYADDCNMQNPAYIGDYTDFYGGIHHANNIGSLFRPDNPLLPNYKHVPIGYHGRASSIRPSGIPVKRPYGQIMPSPEADCPIFAPSRRLDYELELGVWIAQGNALGEAIPIAEAGGHIAGICLLNDWSARDVQAWEYQPLGPFLAKSFHSTISPWVITAEALAPFRMAQPPRETSDPQPLEYLVDVDDQAKGCLSVEMEVFLSTERMRAENLPPHRLSQIQLSNMYWTVAQLIAHQSSNGCNLGPGDLLGSGTISSPDRLNVGSLMEMTRNGTEPIELPTAERRRFLEDGDEVELRGKAIAPGRVSIGFGRCSARIVSSATMREN